MVEVTDYHPPWWLSGPHGQTIFSHFFRGKAKVDLSAERLELDDGDFLDFFVSPVNEGPIVCLFHGLEGSVQSSYMQSMLSILSRLGYQAVLLNFRSCGKINRLPRAYHSGDTGDIRTLIELMRDRYPRRSIAAAAFSLGGNALLKYLGEEGEGCPLVAAAAVSAPCDLKDSCDRISRFDSRFYQWRFLRQLKKKLQLKKDILAGADLNWIQAMKARTFKEFDDTITAPVHGFQDADDYYLRSSSKAYLKKIQIPTLLLQSKDDPMLGDLCYPKESEVSGFVTLMQTQKGGHVGWVAGSPFNPRNWMIDMVFSFLDSAIESSPNRH